MLFCYLDNFLEKDEIGLLFQINIAWLVFTGLISWRGLHLSYIWTIQLWLRLRLTMLRLALGFRYFLWYHFVFLFVKSYAGWDICVSASHLHVYCFQLEGGVKSLRTGGLKSVRTGWLLIWRGGYFCLGGGGGTPLHTLVMVIKCQKWLICLYFLLVEAKNQSQVGENV